MRGTRNRNRSSTVVRARLGDSEPFMIGILERLAPGMGAEVLFEPEFRIVGRIRFPNGHQSYFWHNKFNLNSVSAARIAQDKGYTSFFLKAAGIRVPCTQTFFRDDFRQRIRSSRGVAAACRFAAELGGSVYLKPLRGSQGAGIELATSGAEVRAAARRIFARDQTLLVQESCPGRDYRLVVLDGELISAYERVPLGVTGDGKASIRELLERRQQAFVVAGRDTRINFSDRRLKAGVRRQRLRMTTVLPRGRHVRLLEVANLSCGGDSIDVTSQVHRSAKALAAKVARVLNLRFAGVDILTADITRPLKNYVVLEVNSAPGLDHYAHSGAIQSAHVDGLYRKVLEAVARGPA